jgi:acetylornithine deacetylase/succinyl-diaminopimelate desuccinylase family protein
MAKLSATTRLLRELVAIPSVNPEGNPGTAFTGEKAMAQAVAAYLQKAGADVDLIPVEPDRPNVLGVFRGRGKIRRRILFAPHTDTVSVAGMTIDPFDPVVKQGRLYGRGATDTKGSLAAMLVAMAESLRTPPDGVEFSFVGLVGEEANNIGAHHYAKRCPKYDLVVVGEPTDFKIVYTHKGTCWLKITTKGKAVHASTPDRGVNAILAMARVLERVQLSLERQFSLYNDLQMGAPTFSVGTIQGGSKINVVPDRCEAEVDIRFLPGMDIRRILENLSMETGSARIEVQRSNPPLFTSPTHPLIRAIKPVTCGLTSAPWFCDAAFFNNRNMPSIALGPGSIRQAHTADEYIALADLEDGTACYKKLIERLKLF